jgi:hypothetical protein
MVATRSLVFSSGLVQYTTTICPGSASRLIRPAWASSGSRRMELGSLSGLVS